LRETSGTDDYGNETKADTTVATVCELQPRRAVEGDSAEEISEDDFVAYFLPGQDLSTADALVVDGETYEFVAKPPTWRNPASGLNVYTHANVRRVAGAEDAS